MSMIIQKIDESLPTPSRSYTSDAGLDLYSADGPIQFAPGDHYLLGTGIRVWLSKGTVGLVCPRSGLATKGITVLNGPGVIDEGYHGEILVNLINLSSSPYTVLHGDRIAQLVITPVLQPEIKVHGPDALIADSGHRGQNGHGSSGQ